MKLSKARPRIPATQSCSTPTRRASISIGCWLICFCCYGAMELVRFLRGRPKAGVEKIDYHVDQLSKLEGVTGESAEHPEVAKGWLESDIFDVVNRGTSREAVSSLRPLHLDAHKIRVAKHCRDYNVADAIYASVGVWRAPDTVVICAKYLDQGRDIRTSRFDGRTKLDLETLTVLKLVEGLPDLHPSSRARSFGSSYLSRSSTGFSVDDMQRLLSYRHAVPRPVMIDYLKTDLWPSRRYLHP